VPIDADRLQSLQEAKARALVAAHFGDAPRTSAPVTGCVALHDATTLWLYSPTAAGALGRALAVAAARSLPTVHVLVDDGGDDDAAAGVLARRAAELEPRAQVWQVRGRALVPVAVQPLPPRGDVPPSAGPFIEAIRQAGLEVVVEHGVVVGEVRGLEVARVLLDDGGRAELVVGVGRFDQEATALLHGHLPTEMALERAVDQVRLHRRADAPPHPVNRLGRERWLRVQLLADPAVVGLDDLTAIEPPEPRRNLRDRSPAAAVGHDATGARVLVVCSVGVDLELVPVAADLIRREQPARVVFVTPARDQLPVLPAMAARLPVPSTFVALEGDWPR
jgi:hypothetical protein